MATTEVRWLQQERLRHAQHLLETTTLTIASVASKAGLGSSTNLRRHFTQHIGLTPRAYRRTFQT